MEWLRGATFACGNLDPERVSNAVRQWMPRLGFAYSPPRLSRNLLVRGSVGTFHAVTPPVFLSGGATAFRDPPANLSVTIPTTERTVYRHFLAAGIDLDEAARDDLPAFSNDEVTRVPNGDPYLGAAPQLVSPDFWNPRSVKVTFAIETGLADRMVGALQWMCCHTSRLHGRRDYSRPEANVRPDDSARIPYIRHRQPARTPARLRFCHRVAGPSAVRRHDRQLEVFGRAIAVGHALPLHTGLCERCQWGVFSAAGLYRPMPIRKTRRVPRVWTSATN